MKTPGTPAPCPRRALCLRGRPALCLLFCLCLLCACDNADQPLYQPRYSLLPPDSATVYTFAPHPIMAPQRIADLYGSLVDELNKRLAPDNIRLKLETSRSYAAFNGKLLRNEVHFALPNPYQTVLSQDIGYVIYGKMWRDDLFRGIIVTRRDSPVRTMADLKGRTIAFPAPTALAGTLMPELMLRQSGVNPRSDIVQIFAGTHDSVLMNVAIGSCAAGCTWPQALDDFQKSHPVQAQQLMLRWQTTTLPNNGLVALSSVPAAVRQRVAQAFLHLSDTPEGQDALRRSGAETFVAATNATFAPVYEFIDRYTRLVGPLKGLHE